MGRSKTYVISETTTNYDSSSYSPVKTQDKDVEEACSTSSAEQSLKDRKNSNNFNLYKTPIRKLLWLWIPLLIAGIAAIIFLCLFFGLYIYEGPMSSTSGTASEITSSDNKQGKLLIYPGTPEDDVKLDTNYVISVDAINFESFNQRVEKYPVEMETDRYTDCLLNEPTEQKPCFFKRASFGEYCTDLTKYGYERDSNGKINPCFLFQLTGTWTPEILDRDQLEDHLLEKFDESFLKFECEKLNGNEIRIFPPEGISLNFFRTRLVTAQSYLSPAVMVQVVGLKPNESFTLECSIKCMNSDQLVSSGMAKITVFPSPDKPSIGTKTEYELGYEELEDFSHIDQTEHTEFETSQETTNSISTTNNDWIYDTLNYSQKIESSHATFSNESLEKSYQENITTTEEIDNVTSTEININFYNETFQENLNNTSTQNETDFFTAIESKVTPSTTNAIVSNMTIEYTDFDSDNENYTSSEMAFDVINETTSDITTEIFRNFTSESKVLTSETVTNASLSDVGFDQDSDNDSSTSTEMFTTDFSNEISAIEINSTASINFTTETDTENPSLSTNLTDLATESIEFTTSETNNGEDNATSSRSSEITTDFSEETTEINATASINFATEVNTDSSSSNSNLTELETENIDLTTPEMNNEEDNSTSSEITIGFSNEISTNELNTTENYNFTSETATVSIFKNESFEELNQEKATETDSSISEMNGTDDNLNGFDVEVFNQTTNEEKDAKMLSFTDLGGENTTGNAATIPQLITKLSSVTISDNITDAEFSTSSEVEIMGFDTS